MTTCSQCGMEYQPVMAGEHNAIHRRLPPIRVEGIRPGLHALFLTRDKDGRPVLRDPNQ